MITGYLTGFILSVQTGEKPVILENKTTSIYNYEVENSIWMKSRKPQ